MVVPICGNFVVICTVTVVVLVIKSLFKELYAFSPFFILSYITD